MTSGPPRSGSGRHPWSARGPLDLCKNTSVVTFTPCAVRKNGGTYRGAETRLEASGVTTVDFCSHKGVPGQQSYKLCTKGRVRSFLLCDTFPNDDDVTADVK